MGRLVARGSPGRVARGSPGRVTRAGSARVARAGSARVARAASLGETPAELDIQEMQRKVTRHSKPGTCHLALGTYLAHGTCHCYSNIYSLGKYVSREAELHKGKIQLQASINFNALFNLLL